MGALKLNPRLTPQEYYLFERKAPEKHEYFAGEVFAMAGSSTNHSKVGSNVLIELGVRLKGKRCSPYNSDQRIKVKSSGLRTYPDVSVFCGKMEYDEEDDQRHTATNPTVLFEVLSPSTEGYDRGTKAEHYRRIESLQAYALLGQDDAHVELYERQADGSWRLTEARGLDESLRLSVLDLELKLADIYDGVELNPVPQLVLLPKTPPV